MESHGFDLQQQENIKYDLVLISEAIKSALLRSQDEKHPLQEFAENIIKAGEQVLEKPMEMALMPSWSRVRSAIPFIYEKLIDAVENDNKK